MLDAMKLIRAKSSAIRRLGLSEVCKCRREPHASRDEWTSVSAGSILLIIGKTCRDLRGFGARFLIKKFALKFLLVMADNEMQRK